MRITPLESDGAPTADGGYAQAALIEGHRRLLFISGQVPVPPEKTVPRAADGADTPPGAPTRFADQCRQVWANVEAQLAAANMTTANLVKVTTFLASREHKDENSQIRREILGNHKPALTVLITGIYDESWLLEIEAIATD